MPAAQIRIRFFGSFALEVANIPAAGVPKPVQELLLQLSIAGSRGIDRIEVASLLWPKATPDRARFYLRRCLTQLRSILGEQSWRLSSSGESRISLDLSSCSCDLADFESRTGSDPALALAAAVQSYMGELLMGNQADWVRQIREDYRDRYIRLLLRQADAKLEGGDFDAAQKILKEAIQADPCREETYRLLMRVLHRKGDFPGVAYAFRELRISLRRGIGLSPSPETVDLYRELVTEAQITIPIRVEGISIRATNMVPLPTPVGAFSGRFRGDYQSKLILPKGSKIGVWLL